jgi:PAS domain S-box-containing protein
MHILMVENEKQDYQAAKHTLDKSDLVCEITWVPSGEEALEHLQAEVCDVVLLASNLPGLSGLETFEQIISQELNVPVIFVTESGQESVTAEALRLGAQCYLIKDSPGEYLKLIPTVVRKARGQWQSEQSRKQTEETLQETNARLNTLIEAIPDVIYFKDAQGRNLVVNKAYEELLGLKKEDVIGKTDELLLPPNLAAQCRKSDEEVIQRRELIHFEEQSTNKKDEKVFFDTIKVPLLDDRQNVRGIVGISRYITKHRRAEEALRRHSLEQETMGHIARALNTLDVHDAFPVLVEGLQKLTACDRVSLALLDETSEHFSMTVLESPFPALEEGAVMPVSASAAAEDLLAGQPHLTADLSTETDFPGEQALYQAGFRSRVNLPLLAAGKVVGALNLTSRQLDFFQEDQLPVLQQIADVLANALENSRLFKVEQQQRQEADTLREAALALTAALAQDEVIERILAQLQKVVPYDTCSVQLLRKAAEYGGEEDRLEIVGGRGFPNLPELLGLFFAIGGPNPNTEVVRTQAPVIVADALATYEDFRREPHIQAGVRSWLGVPMLLGKRLVGMIALDKKVAEFYTQEHARLAEAFAAQAAVAVENALLYEQAQQDTDALSVLLHEVNHRVKNNLTGIIGLLYLARNRARVTDRTTYQSTMDDLIGRIRGLASVHSMLSVSEWTPLRLSDLATEIIQAALQAHPRDKHVSVNVPASPVQVTSDQAHNLALVINELATNAIKYALGERDTAQITFQSTLDGNLVRCKFQDDGPGYPEDVLRLARHNVGFELIQNIVRGSLHGELSLHNDHGAVAVIQFKAEIK